MKLNKSIFELNPITFKRCLLTFFFIIATSFCQNSVFSIDIANNETSVLVEENFVLAMLVTCISIAAIFLVAECVDIDYFGPYNVKYYVPDLDSWRIIDYPTDKD